MLQCGKTKGIVIPQHRRAAMHQLVHAHPVALQPVAKRRYVIGQADRNEVIGQ